jgi:ABC-type phosphonate transport system ATPase subunit
MVRNTIARAFACPKTILSNRSGVSIVLQPAVEIEFTAKDVSDGYVHPGGKVRRRLDDARNLVERPAVTDADGPAAGSLDTTFSHCLINRPPQQNLWV